MLKAERNKPAAQLQGESIHEGGDRIADDGGQSAQAIRVAELGALLRRRENLPIQFSGKVCRLGSLGSARRSEFTSARKCQSKIS